MTARPTTADTAQYKALLTQRGAVLAASLKESLSTSKQNDPASRAAEVHDWKDDAFADLLKNTHNTELAHLQAELAAVRAALHRIDDGSYGACSDCGREIGRERLQVQPSATRCLPCQQSVELGAARPRVSAP